MTYIFTYNYNKINTFKGGSTIIYLDYAATTPISEKALSVYGKVSREFFGNASSLHDFGSRADEILTSSREELASLINGNASGLHFTSGGSEANHSAILSLVKAHAHKGSHLITTPGEHSSVLNTFEILENEGFNVSFLPLNETGEVKIEALEKLITDETILVSIGHANADIGTIQPLEQIGTLLLKHQVLFHSDCVQSFGKIPVDVQKAKLSSLSLSSHKIYGPKGVGACYIAPEVPWKPLIPNVTHENGFRAGTVDVPGIAAFVTAASETHEDMERQRSVSAKLRERLFSGIINNKGLVEGHATKVLPQHAALRFPGIEGQYIMLECNRAGIAISTGSACSVGLTAPPKTMLALGRKPDEARELVRITFGRRTTESEIDKIVQALQQITKTFYDDRRVMNAYER